MTTINDIITQGLTKRGLQDNKELRRDLEHYMTHKVTQIDYDRSPEKFLRLVADRFILISDAWKEKRVTIQKKYAWADCEDPYNCPRACDCHDKKNGVEL